MKKFVAISVIVTLTMLLILGCASQPVQPKAEKPAPIMGAEGQPQPDWVNQTPKLADYHFETGYAKLSNKANSIKRANADAKEKISQWVNTKVQSVVVNYTSDYGSGDENRQAVEAFESISRQISNTSLSGVSQEGMWVDADGGVWVLLSMPIENTLKAFEAAAQDFEENEAAAFAEFKKNEALKMLEETLAQE